MHLVDWLAMLLLAGSGAAFVAGETALARATDTQALYWLAVGVVSLRAAVQIARPRAKA